MTLRVILVTVLLNLNFDVFCQTVTIADLDSKYPLEFVAFNSKDGKCFGYSDKRGVVNYSKCTFNSSLRFNFLGYESKEIGKRELKLIDTIFLKKKVFNLKEINIVARRLNLYQELNSILKKNRKHHFGLSVNSSFYLESFEGDSILEIIKLTGADSISNVMFIENNRVVGTFLIKKENPYYSLDIDKFLKSISFFSRKKNRFNHIFAKRKISKKHFLIRLLENHNDKRLIEYTSSNGNTKGFVKYSSKKNEIYEHKYTTKDNLKDILKSLNLNNFTSVDSISLHYYFKNNFLDLILFKIWINKQSKLKTRKILTKGYLKILDTIKLIDKIEIPSYSSYNSLQEELIYSSPMNFLVSNQDNLLSIDSSFYIKNNKSDFLSNYDTLTYNLLNFFNNLKGNNKVWSKSKRLSIKDFVFKEPVIDYSNKTISFLSDLQQFNIKWIIVKNFEDGKTKYFSQKSIWNINESKILYYGKRQAELIANMSFDIYEIFRKQLLVDLNNSIIYDDGKKIKDYYSKASNMVKHFIRETNYGRDLNILKKYNNFINRKIGINNLNLILKKIYKNRYNDNKYSDGDMLAFFGKYKSAIEIYLDYLNSDNLDIETKQNLLINICLIYEKLGNKDKFCFYYNQLRNNDIRSKIYKFKITCTDAINNHAQKK